MEKIINSWMQVFAGFWHPDTRTYVNGEYTFHVNFLNWNKNDQRLYFMFLLFI